MDDFQSFAPEDLFNAYSQGYQGCVFEPEHLKALLEVLPFPKFEDAAYQFGIVGAGEGKLSIPYKSVLEFDPNAYEEKQTTGDCVSHGTRNAVDITRAIDIAVKGQTFGWEARGATEAIYGCRGHGGQGMSCSRAAEYVHRIGGVVLRKNYEGIVDLTKYNSSIGSGWGGRGGPPETLNTIAKQNQAGTISQISKWEAARDALANGYGIAVCSNFGFSGTRDGDGIARPQGSWSHCMAWTACDAREETVKKYGGPLFLVQNSWGAWNGGGQPSYGIPPGSFLITHDVAGRMLASDGSFAFSAVNGFPPQKLPDYGTDKFL